MLIFRRTIVLVQHLIPAISLGDCSVHTSRDFSRNLCTEQSPKHSDDTRCCTNTIVLQTTGYESFLVTCVLHSHLKRVTIPDAVLIQLSFRPQVTRTIISHVRNIHSASSGDIICPAAETTSVWKSQMRTS